MTDSEPQGQRMVEPADCPHCGEHLSIKLSRDEVTGEGLMLCNICDGEIGREVRPS